MSTPFWTRHVFVLLSPDAVYRGVHGAVIDRLRKEGFPPVAARVVEPHPELIDELYADLIAGQWQTWRYRLVDASLTLGPVVGLICRYDGGADAHIELAQRKGYQHPEQARPGTIRRDLGAVNSIVGLMHSSDGAAESEREAAIFGLSADDAADPASATPAIDFLSHLITPHTPEHRDFDRTLASVRVRTLNAVWETLSEPERKAVQKRFPGLTNLGALRAGDSLAGLIGCSIPEPLADVVRCDFEPEWRDRIRMSQAEAHLRTIGVYLDRWERLVLQTSLHFRPRRASRPAGAR